MKDWSVPRINEQLLSRPGDNGQPDHGLGQPNPSPTDEVVRRGQEAMERKRREFDDWMFIAEALQVGRAQVMAAVHTNQPSGKCYEKAMADWLVARGFHLIDKCTRNHLLECLKHRAEIEKWRTTRTEGERFKLNHPTTVLRKWQSATVVSDPNAPPKTSAISKLKEANVELQEKLHRAERDLARGGGDLWDKDDRAEDIAEVMLAKLTTSKAERVAYVILAKLKERKKAARGSKPVATDAAASADERRAHYGAEETGAS
jgi:hypothetical protein